MIADLVRDGEGAGGALGVADPRDRAHSVDLAMSTAHVPSPAHRSRAFLLTYALASAGGVIGYLPLLTLLLPVKIEALAGEARLGVFTATVIAGAIAASLSNIVFGMLSDRSVARGGGRRRWIGAGAVATALAYAGVATAASPTAIVLAIMAFQTAINMMLAPLAAVMADEIPDAQKGVAGGLLALGAPIASMVSALLVGAAMLDETARLAIVPLATTACIVPLLLARSVRLVDIGAERRRTPGPRRDIVIAWSARLLVQIAGNALSLYLLYYFESIVATEVPGDLAIRVGRLLTIAYVVPLPVAVVLGRVSDRTGRRKTILFATAAVAAAGLAGMAVADGWPMGAAAFGVYAVGSAVFLALHAGYAMQLLPNPRHRGRDLGLINLTNTLPALLGPLLTWSLATPHDFTAVMLVLAILTLGGGLVILATGGREAG